MTYPQWASMAFFAGTAMLCNVNALAADTPTTINTTQGDLTVYNSGGSSQEVQYHGRTLVASHAVQVVYSGSSSNADGAWISASQQDDGLLLTSRSYSGNLLNTGVYLSNRPGAYGSYNPVFQVEVPLIAELKDPAGTGLKVTLNGHFTHEGGGQGPFPFTLQLAAKDRSGQSHAVLDVQQIFTTADAGKAYSYSGWVQPGFDLDQFTLRARMDSQTMPPQYGYVSAGFLLDSVLIQPTAVPEPGLPALFGMGIAGLWLVSSRRRPA